MNPTLAAITARIRQRSARLRGDYLARMEAARIQGPVRAKHSMPNLAHAFAAAPGRDKILLREQRVNNIAIVSAYNDMLSAHQPYESYPAIIKQAAREAGAVAQFAGGVPAMCDGVTQGEAGMELSLFSRDTIALSTAVALTHNMFDGALCLGICDKIVPGLIMGALQFGHLPILFVPGGPMPSGMSNGEKVRIRQLYTEGKATREELLDAEAASYHAAGTCTFYGTANSNQMLMEIMGVHLPGSAFVNPGTPLREALTRAATTRVLEITADRGDDYTPLGQVLDERAFVNGIVGLCATGGSTNHTIHLVAMARAAGILIDWTDFDEISRSVPLLASIYPNGKADVNQFQAAGGMAFLVAQLLEAELLHDDVSTVAGRGLWRYAQEPWLDDGKLAWREGAREPGDRSILRVLDEAFSPDGGLRLLTGNLGRAIIKVSAVKHEHRRVEAPAIVFDDQNDVIAAFKRGELERDFIAVVRGQGPRANGMPELHKLTPSLGVLQDRGFKVALVSDGRMSGASGKVPAAIHLSPEAVSGGAIARIRTGDPMLLDAELGILRCEVDAAEFESRMPDLLNLDHHQFGLGRELFGLFRREAGTPEQGASPLF